MNFCPKNALLLAATIAAFGIMSSAHADEKLRPAKSEPSAALESYDAAMIRTINRAWRAELGPAASPVLTPEIRKAGSVTGGAAQTDKRPI